MKKNTVYTLGSLIILLICAFCFVVLPAVEGRTSRSQAGEAPVFGKYNGKEIKYEQGTEFANFVSQYGQMYQMYGQQLDQTAYYQIFNQSFKSTVLNYAYTDEVKKSGYVVPSSAKVRQLSLPTKFPRRNLSKKWLRPVLYRESVYYCLKYSHKERSKRNP